MIQGAEETQRVMLVDDDGVCLAMLARGLRKRGYEVATFGDPVRAMEALGSLRPRAIVTDMRMPRMNGLDVVREVRSRLGDAAPPVLVVSADGDEHLLLEAFRLGAADYLLKPVSDVELGVKLGRALQARNSTSQAIPGRIGPWRLHEPLGRGGTACVFVATREGAPERRYALKVVWPHLIGTTETMLRFRREIDTLAVLDHPRLVRFVESGRQEHCFYYVMEHVGGGTLRERIRERGARPVVEALDMMQRLLEPLGYLHARGIVHRDVKPSNVFFQDEQDVVLGDFGLARRLLDRGITLGEEFIGTPLYLAPEVFRTAEFDESVDLYALGVCGLEMLAGRAPLEETDPVRLIGALMDSGLPPPRELVPDLPAAVDTLLSRVLAYDPADRYRTAEALGAAITATRDGLSRGIASP